MKNNDRYLWNILNLDENFKWGENVLSLRQAYRNKGEYKITEEEKREAEELGLILNLKNREAEKKDAISKNKQTEQLSDEYEKFVGNRPTSFRIKINPKTSISKEI